jgi:CDP-diacylglycerol pyrophosphatase
MKTSFDLQNIMTQQYVLLMTFTFHRMRLFSKQFYGKLLLAFGIAFVPLSHSLAAAFSDTLLHIVQHCVDTSAPNYCQACKAPRASAQCTPEASCRKSTEVWAMDNDFVALRDIKMCGCPREFVHGLALPLQVVTGVEDPLRPDTIWAFAWAQASQRLPTSEIALVVNPKNQRSQNQLHVHMLRLKPQAHAALKTWPHTTVQQLRDVWTVATSLAQQQSYSDYGVLVTPVDADTFQVVVSPNNPEHLFTEYVCAPS